MWLRVLGTDTDATAVDLDWFEDFVARRASGEIDGRGKRVAEKDRKAVRPRTVELDAHWLVWVYYWAARFKPSKRDRQRLLPTGLVDLKELREGVGNWPNVENVRRPVATVVRYEQVRKVAGQIRMKVGNTRVESYLEEILDLAFHTGRRLSSILNLRHSDFTPTAEDEQGRKLPFGAVTWRGEYDKQGKQWISALNQEAQKAILKVRRVRPGVGDALMFPSPENPTRPVARTRVDKWLRKAETLAGLEPQDGTLWHGYRRGWATARSHLPAVTTAHTGGWRSAQTMERCYQQTGLAAQLEVVSNPVKPQQETG
jgi:integrase